ncbi:hypothetical protein A9Q99_07255 [Gammaproteobacteria bacterium 45_16_T64]|nr:hypothetical protein A9Q99_07255 [Gammaproteobacteria bacterium 45_16_T64]
MFDLNEMAVFAKVVDTGSFTKAADKLGLPKSTVSRKISQLEERLGVRLLNRTTRALKPTETGKAYYHHCAKMVEEADEANSLVTNMQAEPSGMLRVSAPLAFGEPFLQDMLEEFLSLHPQISIELILDNRNVDLVEEEYDAAFRVGPLADSSFVARSLGAAQLVICASPEYLEKNPVPRTPQDLHDHSIVRHPSAAWELQGPDGIEVLELKSRLALNDMSLVKSVLKRGMGIGMLPCALAHEELQNGELLPLLLDFPFTEKMMYLVYPSRKQPPSKLVSFIEFVVERCRPMAPWAKEMDYPHIP